MGRTPDEVSYDIRQKLSETLPGLSMEIGTPERKLIDAAAESISEAYIDQYLSGSALDIDTKSGLELEQFVGLFGFGRLQGRRSKGIVRVEMKTLATQNIDFAQGSQFFVPRGGVDGSPLYFSSTQPVSIPTGSLSVDVPVECTIEGSIGNVGPGTITSVSNNLGTTNVTNLAAMVGGMDPESDNELRTRFKATFLRNITGTKDFYHGIALQNQNVSRVEVYGPTSLYRTQIVAPTDVYTLPIGSDAHYTWSDATVFRDLAQPTETFFTPGIDYNFQSGTSAAFFRLDGGGIEPGDILDIEFEYTSRASRNDPLNGVTNKVDVYVDGVDPNFITEKTRVSTRLFSSSPSHELYTGNFVRNLTGATPSKTNRFMRLGSTPVVSFPSTIVVGTTTYVEGTHYFFVRGTTSLQGSIHEIAGVEWFPSGPADNTPILVSYSYNRTPELVNAVLKKSKQLTTDVLVHQARYRYLRFCLAVEYEPGFSIQMTNNNINQVIRNYVSTFPYGSWVEFSDLTYIVHGIRGVDNVWVATDADNPVDYGIQDYEDVNSTSPSDRHIEDFKLADGELPALKDVVITRKVNR